MVLIEALPAHLIESAVFKGVGIRTVRLSNAVVPAIAEIRVQNFQNVIDRNRLTLDNDVFISVNDLNRDKLSITAQSLHRDALSGHVFTGESAHFHKGLNGIVGALSHECQPLSFNSDIIIHREFINVKSFFIKYCTKTGKNKEQFLTLKSYKKKLCKSPCQNSAPIRALGTSRREKSPKRGISPSFHHFVAHFTSFGLSFFRLTSRPMAVTFFSTSRVSNRLVTTAKPFLLGLTLCITPTGRRLRK